jgi:hypothetical protein
MENENLDHLVNMRRQSMIEVETSLCELKTTVSAWPLLSSEGLEPQRGLMVEHLEDMLTCLEDLCADNDDSRTGSVVSRTGSVVSREDDDHTPEDVGGNEVCIRCLHVINSC